MINRFRQRAGKARFLYTLEKKAKGVIQMMPPAKDRAQDRQRKRCSPWQKPARITEVLWQWGQSG